MPNTIEIRPVEPGDLPGLCLHQRDDESCAMAAVHPRDDAAFAAHWAKIFGDPDVVARAIVADGAVVGQISCFTMDERRHVGYWIARDHWGRGVATRALALILEEVSERPLWARAARSNGGSIRVLERCGFVLEGYEMSPATERLVACEEAVFRLD